MLIRLAHDRVTIPAKAAKPNQSPHTSCVENPRILITLHPFPLQLCIELIRVTFVIMPCNALECNNSAQIYGVFRTNLTKAAV